LTKKPRSRSQRDIRSSTKITVTGVSLLRASANASRAAPNALGPPAVGTSTRTRAGSNTPLDCSASMRRASSSVMRTMRMVSRSPSGAMNEVTTATMTSCKAMKAIDPSMFEAAVDLGAGWWTQARKILIPLAAPGIFIAMILVYIPMLTDFPSTLAQIVVLRQVDHHLQ